MRVSLESVKPSKKRTAVLCGFVLEDTNQVIGLGKINSEIDSAIKDSIGEMRGKLAKISIINTLQRTPARRILLAGLGKKRKISNDTIRFVSGKIALKARELNLPDFTIIPPDSSVCEITLAASQIVEGSKLSLYSFDNFKADKTSKSPNLTILAPKSSKISKAIRSAENIADGAIFAKSLGNLPPNECSPDTLGRYAKKLCAKTKLKCTILGKKELKKKGFGGISAVGQGSKNEPKLIIIEYNGATRNQKPIVIVGKAVTFDTGGISLKPGEKMDEMKFDKCGGCTVFGIMKAVESLRLPLNVVGIIPSVENMPDGESYRPGDIIKLYSGKTAEILNTDAEGRLILADALSYGEKHYSPKEIIDFATLTGACIVALGTNVAGLVSNDQSFAKRIKDSSDRTTEQVWELPLNDDYMNMIKSDVADMKNMGIGRAAGTITAAAFLKNAVEKTPWAHLDIAGVAWTQTATKEKPYNPKGATGFGVRLIIDYLQTN